MKTPCATRLHDTYIFEQHLFYIRPPHWTNVCAPCYLIILVLTDWSCQVNFAIGILPDGDSLSCEPKLMLLCHCMFDKIILFQSSNASNETSAKVTYATKFWSSLTNYAPSFYHRLIPRWSLYPSTTQSSGSFFFVATFPLLQVSAFDWTLLTSTA